MTSAASVLHYYPGLEAIWQDEISETYAKVSRAAQLAYSFGARAARVDWTYNTNT